MLTAGRRSGVGVVTALGRALLRRRGTPEWDAVVRGTGVAALFALYPTLHWPGTAGLVAFLCITIFVNGPLAPLLPAAYEPVLMIAGRVYPWLIVGFVGILGILYIEFLNYHLYRAALLHPRLEKARNSKLARQSVRLFEKSPFFAVWLCAWSPLPYWVVRFLGPLSGYPIQRYLWATFLGRFPRLCFFAALGLVVPISTQVLVTVTLVVVAVAVAVAVHRHSRTAPARPAPQAAAVMPGIHTTP